MGYGIALEVWGDYALFTRPEFKVERMSYDVMTPSAARGIIEAIYWKPAIKWTIDRIIVYNEPKFDNIRRNEVSEKISHNKMKRLMQGKEGKNNYLVTSQAIQQRASTVLRNVRYVIVAHFELTSKAGESDTKEKHYNIALRRMRKGQCYHTPYFGCREFPVKFRLVEDEIPESELSGTRDLGFMLYDMDFSDKEQIDPMFFRCKMNNGSIDLRDVDLRR